MTENKVVKQLKKELRQAEFMAKFKEMEGKYLRPLVNKAITEYFNRYESPNKK